MALDWILLIFRHNITPLQLCQVITNMPDETRTPVNRKALDRVTIRMFDLDEGNVLLKLYGDGVPLNDILDRAGAREGE